MRTRAVHSGQIDANGRCLRAVGLLCLHNETGRLAFLAPGSRKVDDRTPCRINDLDYPCPSYDPSWARAGRATVRSHPDTYCSRTAGPRPASANSPCPNLLLVVQYHCPTPHPMNRLTHTTSSWTNTSIKAAA